MFAHFSLPDLAAVSRRTMIGALVAGVVGLVACLALSAVLVGVGLCLGIAAGIVNYRLIQASVVKIGRREDENKRRPLAFNTLTRLGIATAIALGLLFLSFDLGAGFLVGLAIFQVLLLANVARSMYQQATVIAQGGSAHPDAIDVDAVDAPPPPAIGEATDGHPEGA